MVERAPTGEAERKKAKDADDVKPERESKPSLRDKERGSLVPPSAQTPRPKPGVEHAKEPASDPHPSIPPLPAAGPWRSYKEIVAGLATTRASCERPMSRSISERSERTAARCPARESFPSAC